MFRVCSGYVQVMFQNPFFIYFSPFWSILWPFWSLFNLISTLTPFLVLLGEICWFEGVGGGGPRTFITRSLAMSWETVSRTPPGKLFCVESCYLESFGFLRLWFRVCSEYLQSIFRVCSILKLFHHLAPIVCQFLALFCEVTPSKEVSKVMVIRRCINTQNLVNKTWKHGYCFIIISNCLKTWKKCHLVLTQIDSR